MALDDIQPMMHIDVYSHNVRLWKFTPRGKEALLEYCRGLAQYGLVRVGRGRFEKKMLRVFVGVTNDRSEFHFHRNQYEDLLRQLARYGVTEKYIKTTVHEMYEPVSVEFPLKDTRPLFDYQVPIVNYLVEPCLPGYAPSKVVTLQTGKGKTKLALSAIHQIGQRTVLVIKGMYVEKWIDDVKGSSDGEVIGAFQMGKEDLMVVRGTQDLQALIALGRAGELRAKFIIITSKTMFNYMKTYEKFKQEDVGYQVDPMDFYETVGAGVRLIDEVHQDFHCNFRQDLYSHVPKTISLSATLDADEAFMNHIYRVVWPDGTRAPEVAYDRFIEVNCLWYSINKPHYIRCTNAMKQYSHTKFEQSIMKNDVMMQNYLKMITDIVNFDFVRVMDRGQKMMIFCGTIEMCTQVAEHLANIYRDLKIARYVGEDEYEQLLNADIVVSTVLSAGTAVDVPNLRVTLMTTALNSKQANIQVLGRTRKLRDWPDVTPKFLFLAAREMPKHVEYAQAKDRKFEGKVLGFKDLQTSFRV